MKAELDEEKKVDSDEENDLTDEYGDEDPHNEKLKEILSQANPGFTYYITAEIGRGGQGIVYLASLSRSSDVLSIKSDQSTSSAGKNRGLFALKIIDKSIYIDDLGRELLDNEIECLRQSDPKTSIHL